MREARDQYASPSLTLTKSGWFCVCVVFFYIEIRMVRMAVEVVYPLVFRSARC